MSIEMTHSQRKEAKRAWARYNKRPELLTDRERAMAIDYGIEKKRKELDEAATMAESAMKRAEQWTMLAASLEIGIELLEGLREEANAIE